MNAMPNQIKSCLDWQAHKAELQYFYLEKDYGLKAIAEYMKETHGFIATHNTKASTKKWGFRKNLTNEEWDYTLRQVRKRKLDKKESEVYLNGRLIPPKKFKKEMSRHFSLTQQQLYDTASIPSTPEALTVSTPTATTTAASNIDILHNLPYFNFQALLESRALHLMVPAQDPLVGTAQQIALDSPNFDLLSFTTRDFHDNDAIALLHKIAFPISAYNEDVLTKLFGPTMNANGNYNGFLSHLYSQMLVSSLERYDGELLEKSQHLCDPSRQSFVLRILELALYRLSNNLLSEAARDALMRWLIKPQQNKLLASFLKIRIPTVHACATKFFESVLRLRNADFLELLIDSEIDISSLKGHWGRVHLWEAAARGDSQIVQILLKNGAPVNGLYKSQTSHMVAIWDGNADIVQVLLKAGANVNALADSRCNTALSIAVYNEEVEIVHILLSAGANIDICRIVGKSAIQYSALRTHDEELHQILLSASSKNYSSISRAGVLEAADTVTQALSEYLAEIGETGALRQKVLESALKSACNWYCPCAVISLLDIGVDPNCGLHKRSPLLTAVYQGDFEIIKILLRGGANLNTPGILISAISYDQGMPSSAQMLRFMLDAGANIKTQGESAVRYAAYKGYSEAVNFLVLSGVDVNADSEANSKANSKAGSEADSEFDYTHDDTAHLSFYHRQCPVLQYAVLGREIAMVKSLLSMGADVNAVHNVYHDEECQMYQTALESAFRGGEFGPRRLEMGIARRFLEAGADVNAAAAIIHGRTALDGAAEHGRLDMVQMLLNAGVLMYTTGKGGGNNELLTDS